MRAKIKVSANAVKLLGRFYMLLNVSVTIRPPAGPPFDGTAGGFFGHFAAKSGCFEATERAPRQQNTAAKPPCPIRFGVEHKKEKTYIGAKIVLGEKMRDKKQKTKICSVKIEEKT